MPAVASITEADVATLLRALADQAQEYAVILMDPDGRIVWWNAGAETIFGLSREAATGRHASMIFTPDDLQLGIADLEMKIARTGSTAEDDRWHVRADGSRFWSSGALVALRNARGELLGFGKFLRNRTNIKELIERLREESRVAREAERKQKVGVATLSHELRNLLSALRHGTKLLQSQGDDADRRIELLSLIERQTALLQRLTEDLFDISRIGRGALQLERTQVVLQDIVNETLSALSARAEEKSLQVTVLAPPGPIIVHADPARLQQIVANLLDNAIKYTPANGSIWVKVTVEDPEGVVHVEDTGIGIPANMLQEIFELFTQVETDLSRKGLGIGLALVKDLVALHGGTVQARSEGEGKGSEFTVRLPLANA